MLVQKQRLSPASLLVRALSRVMCITKELVASLLQIFQLLVALATLSSCWPLLNNQASRNQLPCVFTLQWFLSRTHLPVCAIHTTQSLLKATPLGLSCSMAVVPADHRLHLRFWVMSSTQQSTCVKVHAEPLVLLNAFPFWQLTKHHRNTSSVLMWKISQAYCTQSQVCLLTTV